MSNLSHSLCLFIPEVTKIKDGAPYPGATLYQMVIAIQHHLNKGGLNWKLIDVFEFKNVKTILDNVMKESTRKHWDGETSGQCNKLQI